MKSVNVFFNLGIMHLLCQIIKTKIKYSKILIKKCVAVEILPLENKLVRKEFF